MTDTRVLITVFAILFILPLSRLAAHNNENGLFGQLQLGVSRHTNDYSREFLQTQKKEIQSSGYSITETEKGGDILLDLRYHLSYMKNGIGAGFATGLMTGMDSHEVRYYESGTTLSRDQAKCSVKSFYLPQNVLFEYARHINDYYTFKCGIGPGLYFDIDTRNYTVSDGLKKADYDISGKDSRFSTGLGAYGFLQLSYNVNYSMSIDAGVNCHFMAFAERQLFIPTLFFGVTERSPLF